jgi:excisionase family DNA binding protein
VGSTGRAPRSLARQSSALPRFLTLRQAASYLAVSAGTVRGWVASGTLPTVRLPGGGKLLWIERAALDRLIEASRES